MFNYCSFSSWLLTLLYTFSFMLFNSILITSKFRISVAVGWHESRGLMQQPPHLLIRVQSGKTNVEGSSSTFRETSCSSGMHLAGTGIIAFDRSSPPNLSGKNSCLYLKRNQKKTFFFTLPKIWHSLQFT